MLRHRLPGLVAVAATLLVCVAGSPAPAQAGGHPLTGVEWHRLHPQLCHTVGDHTPL